ncbi:hypothetical protein AC578_10598 [Pseudocercospora eumusae]|uniref:F-box domain-containing protein n=1 Tax=Pseudocercospora eumusae TaxID=321146 RepID=A0A139HKP3_9PEZI|nr:hypothetical protein AC578_10598 [Pseudocercospora eumusae]
MSRPPPPTDCINNHTNLHTMPVTSHKADQAKTGFLDLPPELRNAIYDFALVRPDPIRFELARNNEFGDISRIHSYQYGYFALNLLRTCAQVFHEATKVFYGANTFRFMNGFETAMFFRKQKTWSVEDLCNIEICHTDYLEVEDMVHSLRGAKNLKHIMIDMNWEPFLDLSSEAPDAAAIAATLQPLAEIIYHNQETKDKQEVLATFCFGEYSGGKDGVFEETEHSAKLETAVRGRLYDVIPDGEVISSRCLSDEESSRLSGRGYEMEDVETTDFETEDDADSSGDEASMIDDEESSSEESDDSDDMGD